MSPKAMYFRDVPWARDLSAPLLTQAWGPFLLGTTSCLPTAPPPLLHHHQPVPGPRGGALSLCLPFAFCHGN